MNGLDRLITAIAPQWGLSRFHARQILAAYEAAKPSPRRKFHRDNRSGDAQVSQAGQHLRNQARHLEQNHDIARGILTIMVNFIVGPQGIGIEPQPKNKQGEILEDFARELLHLWRDWTQNPEVTNTRDWASCQRLLCRSWLRDGEGFAQMISGAVPKLNHGTAVPLSLELLEADMVPLEYNDPGQNIIQGIQRSAWGSPQQYWVFKQHPGNLYPYGVGALPGLANLKAVPADRMLHIKMADRIGQLRGVTVFASIIERLGDIYEYEESERIAAKIAASITGYIKRSIDAPIPENQAEDKEFRFSPGMFFDGLGVGEDIGLVDSNRPNTNLEEFRKGQLRAVAAGVGASYSSIARDYNGTYSSQRQELVEQFIHYQVLANEFIGQAVQPVWQQFVAMAQAAGLIVLPRDLDPRTLDDAMFQGQSMPWINPKHEADAWETLERAGYRSAPEIIRQMGGNPRDVMQQEANWRKQARDKELVYTGDPANDKGAKESAPATLPD